MDQKEDLPTSQEKNPEVKEEEKPENNEKKTPQKSAKKSTKKTATKKETPKKSTSKKTAQKKTTEKKETPEESKTETKKETKAPAVESKSEKKKPKERKPEPHYTQKDRTVSNEEFEKYNQLLNKKTARKKKTFQAHHQIKKSETIDNRHIKNNIPNYRRSYSKSNHIFISTLNSIFENLDKKEKNDKTLKNKNTKISYNFSFRRKEHKNKINL